MLTETIHLIPLAEKINKLSQVTQTGLANVNNLRETVPVHFPLEPVYLAPYVSRGLNVFVLVCVLVFIYIHILCTLAAKALASLRFRAGLSVPPLLFIALSTKISCWLELFLLGTSLYFMTKLY